MRASNHQDLKDADLRFTCTNATVLASNKQYIRELPGQMVTFEADNFKDNMKSFVAKVDFKGCVEPTGFQQKLEIKEHAKVMLIHNLDTSDSLTNGQRGVVVKLIPSPSGQDKIDKLAVKFNNTNVGKKWRRENPQLAAKYPNCVLIERCLYTYSLRQKKGVEGSTATLYQFPLWLANCMTGHKVQGQTVPVPQKVVVNLNDIHNGCSALAYVMLSRVQRLDQIYIEKSFKKDFIKVDQAALAETERLRRISWNQNPSPWMKTDNNRALKVASLNCARLSAHLQFMKNDERLLRADLLQIQETWLQPGAQEVPAIDGYRSHLVSVGNGRGIASYSKLSSSTMESVNKEGFQVGRLAVGGIVSVNVYRSADGSPADLIDVLENRMIDPDQPTLITGDFNICTMKKPRNLITKTLVERLGFALMIKEATHICGGHIDHVYWRDPTGQWDIPVIERYSPFYSDHDALLVTLRLAESGSQPL